MNFTFGRELRSLPTAALRAAVENKRNRFDVSHHPVQRAFGNGSESESESDSRYVRGSSHRASSLSKSNTASPYLCSLPVDRKAEMPDVEIVQKNKVKINRLLYKFVNKLEETKEWPTKCNTLCWWCCHSFESIPIPCVSKYDSIRKRFKIYGIFCSWNCAAAHAMKENDSILNLQLLKREWTGDASNIERSPSKYILKAFGGHMSIEEYRNNNGVQRSFHITKNNMDFINHNCIETYTETSKKVKSKYKLKRKNDNNISAPLFDTASPYPLTDGHPSTRSVEPLTDGHASGLDEY